MAHKEPSEALRLLATATAIKPLDHGVHHNAGLALSALGLFGEAADAYRGALNIHAMNGRTWMKLGWSLYQLTNMQTRWLVSVWVPRCCRLMIWKCR